MRITVITNNDQQTKKIFIKNIVFKATNKEVESSVKFLYW